MTRLAATPIAILLLAACTFPPLETATPRTDAGPATATPSVSPGPSPAASASPTPSPTPDPALVPPFTAGERVATTTDGLRVRALPGIDRAVLVERLPTGAQLSVVMGPLHTDAFGWYLVADADPAEPAFDEGWIAAGYLPDAFLALVPGGARDERYVASFGHSGPGEFGPVALSDAQYALRWLAVDPDGAGCRFDVSLATASSGLIPAVRDSSSGSPIRGQLHSSFFAENPALVGHVFVTVATDCTWALGFSRVLPEESPSPALG